VTASTSKAPAKTAAKPAPAKASPSPSPAKKAAAAKAPCNKTTKAVASKAAAQVKGL
jgi:hypothetical protein